MIGEPALAAVPAPERAVPDAEPETSEVIRFPASARKGPRVLIVDDDDVVRESLFELLQEMEVKAVGQASNGFEAIQGVRTLRPDVVLMDLRMPGMGGLEAAHCIKAEWPQTQVLFLSAYDDPGLDRSAAEAGAFCYLVKGCSVDLIVSMIDQAWQHGQGA